MAITDKKEGVWDTEEAYNKKNAGYWGYSSRGEGKSLWAWGDGGRGELGLNDIADRSSPVQVGTETTWASLQGSRTDISFAIKSDGTMWSWGSNFSGALGLNMPAGPGPSPAAPALSSPTQIPGTNWRSIGSISLESFYATKFDGTLWVWGGNEYGGLGRNVGGSSGYDGYLSSPTQLGTDTTWDILNHSSGKLGDTGVAIKTDGTMWAWGLNSGGALGQGTQISYSSPVQVGTDTTWKSFTCNYRGVVATKTDGTLWGWGYNDYGNLGLNQAGTPARRSSPTQVGTDTDWDNIQSGSYEAIFARKTDGTLWSWGRNEGGNNRDGYLGLNDTITCSSPTQVGTDTTWTSSMSSYTTTGGIKTDGTLWVWGGNEYGEMAQNNKENVRSSPTQVGTDTNWYARTDVDPDYVRTIAHTGFGFLALRTPS